MMKQNLLNGYVWPSMNHKQGCKWFSNIMIRRLILLAVKVFFIFILLFFHSFSFPFAFPLLPLISEVFAGDKDKEWENPEI
ncbi:hypothetical protein BDV29DRAFT_169418 [Aspergillus leporis]|uniref:Transmembrane protein n=1 Tax=Aspergillus leporis TaxID=41062 RepID=A0A5N5X7M8_9EURO|nr:hypothetical protein BDV29DRAFT_169418 [Aspergillus leporis]